MSKFELFKKLNLLIQVSGIKDDPQYCGMLNVARPQPSDAIKFKWAETSDTVGGVNNERIDVYPNPMAVKYLMNICEDVLISKVPNRKDEFQLVALAFQLAVSRLSLAIVENRMYEFHECEPLTDNYNNGLSSSGASLGNELRHILDTFKLNQEYTESAVSNTLTCASNSGYVKQLDIDPKVCVLYPLMYRESFKEIIKYTMFGAPKAADDVAPNSLKGAPSRNSISTIEAFSMLGLIDVDVNLANDESVTTYRPTLLGKSLLRDLEVALENWTDLKQSESGEYTVDPVWYKHHIESSPELLEALAQLLLWDSFAIYQHKLSFDRLNQLPVTQEDEKKITDKRYAILSKAKALSLTLNESLNNVKIRLALTQFGLVVRNPLYDSRDDILKYNPPLILSGFGIVVARHVPSKGVELKDNDE